MLEKIIAEMPRVSINSVSEDDQVEFGIYPHAVEIIAEAQCKLLAEQRYRPVPSKAELGWQIILAIEDYNNEGLSDESLSEYICHWLLGYMLLPLEGE